MFFFVEKIIFRSNQLKTPFIGREMSSLNASQPTKAIRLFF